MTTLYCKNYKKIFISVVYRTFYRIFAGMKLHVFNPEHDIALAFGGKYFTAPQAGRKLRSDLGYLPVLWADDGDVVLVDDVDSARNEANRLPIMLPEVIFVTPSNLQSLAKGLKISQVSPWGWDAAIAYQLEKNGIPECLLPSEKQLRAVREISNRRWAAEHLGNKGVACESANELCAWAERFGSFVLKAPWSSSGRGIRYKMDLPWALKVIEQQGAIMIEPMLDKLLDFGMEFHSTEDGIVVYDGLSLFETSGSAYVGNILASEEEKEAMLARHVEVGQLADIRQSIITIMSKILRNVYTGPFGVDMMVYESGGRKCLAPCVELNLRRTMGHVALDLYARFDRQSQPSGGVMRIVFDGYSYRLTL